MAKFCELAEPEWSDWVATRPPVVQDLCRCYLPNLLYRLKNTNERVRVIAYAEDGTMRVHVSGEWNFVMYEHEVFGIHPEDLEICELPNVGERLGVVLTKQVDIDRYIAEQVSILQASRLQTKSEEREGYIEGIQKGD